MHLISAWWILHFLIQQAYSEIKDVIFDSDIFYLMIHFDR